LVLVGQVKTSSLDPNVDEPTELAKPEISDSEIQKLLDDLL
jgi:hypothetical protein